MARTIQSATQRWLRDNTLAVAWFALILVGLYIFFNSYFYNSLQVDDGVKRMASNIGLTRHGENLFYQVRPDISDRATILEKCGEHGEESMLLGCYIPSIQKVFIVNNRDEAFRGVSTITAAHELLHYAYQGLPFWTKAEINEKLEYEVDNNTELQKYLSSYEDADRTTLLDEAHSFLGTMFKDVDPELDYHYSNYFTNRTALVSLSRSVEVIIDTKVEKLNAVIERLTNVEKNLKDLESRYDSCVSVGDRYCVVYSARLYNSEVENYNRIKQEYDSELADQKDLMERYTGKSYQNYQEYEIINL